jgi:hypothetical protein
MVFALHFYRCNTSHTVLRYMRHVHVLKRILGDLFLEESNQSLQFRAPCAPLGNTQPLVFVLIYGSGSYRNRSWRGNLRSGSRRPRLLRDDLTRLPVREADMALKYMFILTVRQLAGIHGVKERRIGRVTFKALCIGKKQLG